MMLASILSERYEGHVVLGSLRAVVVPATLAAVIVFDAWLLLQVRRRRATWMTFAVAQAFGIAFWFFGELKVNYLTRFGFGDRPPLPPFEEFSRTGDPNLANWVDSQTAITARPSLADSGAFARWQAETRQRLRTEMIGTIGAERPSEFRVVSERRIDSITRQLVSFNGFDGTPIPAYLFRPAGTATRAPAILVLSGNGHGIVETAGLIDSYQHAAARELARAGFVTFAPEFRGQGYLGERLGTDQCIVGYNAIIGGSFYAALESRDLIRAVDVLSAMPFVDSSRIGVTGVSKGGLYSVISAALDPRIRAVVAQSTLLSSFVSHGLRASWNRRITPTAPACHAIYGSRHAFGEYDLAYLIAPRPFLLVAGIRETGMSQLQSAADSAVRPAYAALGRPDAFQRLDMDGRHEYFVGPAATFFNRHLVHNIP